MTTFRQVLVGASPEDAITGMAQRLGKALVGAGSTELYAHHVAPELAGHVGRLRDLPRAKRGDVLIYHSSYGEPEVTRVLMGRREPIVLVYHNLTPSEFFLEHDPAKAASLEWGRHELRLIRDRVATAVAVSAFNVADLRRYGYDRVSVMPVGLDPKRLHEVAPDSALGIELSERLPNGYVLWVSQVLPHKRLELLLGAMHLLRWVHRHEHGLVIVGANRLDSYWQAAHRFARRLNLPDVLFTGVVSDAQLSTLFRRASLFVSTSAHEGLALPPIEAMSFGVPVIASDAGALRDTIADGGLVLPSGAGPVLFAEAMHEVVSNERLRCELTVRGLRRVEQLGRAGAAEQFLALLQEG